MESSKTVTLNIRYIPVSVDQEIEKYLSDEYAKTGTKRTKQSLLFDCLEYGLKQRGIVE